MVAQCNELNLFQTISSSELIKHIIKATEHNHSPIDHNISSSISEVLIDMYSGDAQKGYTLFKKKLETPCQISPIEFAIAHTQEEWEAIVEAGKFREETLQLCPDSETQLKATWLPHLYQFAYEYAIDSGNIPSDDE